MPHNRTFRKHNNFQPAVRNSSTWNITTVAFFSTCTYLLTADWDRPITLNDERTFWHQQPGMFVPWIWLQSTALNFKRRSVVVTNNRVIRESGRIHKCTSILWRSSHSHGQITYSSQWISFVRNNPFGLRYAKWQVPLYLRCKYKGTVVVTEI